MNMKCTSCGSEWSVSDHVSASLSKCPFCGQPLAIAKKDEISGLEDGFTQIIDGFGLDAVRNAAKLVALFSDLAPHLKKEKRLLRTFCECKGSELLVNVRDSSSEEQATCCRRIVLQMTENYFISQEAAELICSSFLNAVSGVAAHGAGREINSDAPIHNAPQQNVLSLDQGNIDIAELHQRLINAILYSVAKNPNREKAERNFRMLEAIGKTLCYGAMLPQGAIDPLRRSSRPQDRFELGMRLLYGYQVEMNVPMGLKVLTELAAQGYYYASFVLASHMADADGDYEKAFRLLETAINGGCYRLLTTIGVLHNEKNTPDRIRNKKFELQCYELGTQLAVDACINNLGWAYEQGIEVPKDDRKAFELYSRAAAMGYPRAKANLGRCYKDGIYVKQDLKLALDFFYCAFLQDPAHEAYGFTQLISNKFPVNDMIAKEKFLEDTSQWGQWPCLSNIQPNLAVQMFISLAIGAKYGSTGCALRLSSLLSTSNYVPFIPQEEPLTQIVEQIIEPHTARPAVSLAAKQALHHNLSLHYSVQANRQCTPARKAFLLEKAELHKQRSNKV